MSLRDLVLRWLAEYFGTGDGPPWADARAAAAQPRDTQALAAAWLATLTGSSTPGQYQHPTLMERLDTAVEAGWTVANQLGVTVPVIASTAPGPYAGDDTVAHELADQILAAYPGAAATSRPRTALQRVQQLVALEQAIMPALTASSSGSGGGGATAGTLPPGTTQGTLTWAPKPFVVGSDSTKVGYSPTVQREASDMAIHNTNDPVPIVSTPWGPALQFTLPGNYVRVEVQPPDQVNRLSSGVVWFGSWTAFGDSFPVNTSKWAVCAQVHGDDVVSPKFSLQVNHEQLRLGDTTTICPVTTGRRYDWVMSCDLDHGLVSVWVDGVLRLDQYRCGVSKWPGWFKTGWYHSASDPGGTLWHGPLKVGSGYGAVAPV